MSYVLCTMRNLPCLSRGVWVTCFLRYKSLDPHISLLSWCTFIEIGVSWRLWCFKLTSVLVNFLLEEVKAEAAFEECSLLFLHAWPLFFTYLSCCLWGSFFFPLGLLVNVSTGWTGPSWCLFLALPVHILLLLSITHHLELSIIDTENIFHVF